MQSSIYASSYTDEKKSSISAHIDQCIAAKPSRKRKRWPVVLDAHPSTFKCSVDKIMSTFERHHAHLCLPSQARSRLVTAGCRPEDSFLQQRSDRTLSCKRCIFQCSIPISLGWLQPCLGMQPTCEWTGMSLVP